MPNKPSISKRILEETKALTRADTARLSAKLNHNQSQSVQAQHADTALSQAMADEALMSSLAALRQKLQTRGLSISLNGIKGTGKTTLSRQLKAVCAKAGVPTHSLHIYRWYSNLFVIPWTVLHNRFVRKELLILDRTIIDNLAVWFVSLPRMFLEPTAILVRLIYPRFDYRFYLSAEMEVLAQRRPGSDSKRLAILTANYEKLTAMFNHVEFSSDVKLLENILRHLVKL